MFYGLIHKICCYLFIINLIAYNLCSLWNEYILKILLFIKIKINLFNQVLGVFVVIYVFHESVIININTSQH